MIGMIVASFACTLVGAAELMPFGKLTKSGETYTFTSDNKTLPVLATLVGDALVNATRDDGATCVQVTYTPAAAPVTRRMRRRMQDVSSSTDATDASSSTTTTIAPVTTGATGDEVTKVEKMDATKCGSLRVAGAQLALLISAFIAMNSFF